MNRNYYFAAGAIILATLVGTLVAYSHLPAIVPMHWDARGHVNGWGPRWMLFLFGPGMMGFIVLTFAAIPWLSPKQFEVESFRSTYLFMLCAILALLAYIQLLVVLAALGTAVNMSRAMIGGICLLFTLLGNVMGKVRRNFFIGIRTPWTLASEQVWNATHRFAATTFFAGGLAGLFFVLFNAPFWLPMSALLGCSLSPIIYSLMLYKRLEGQGAL